MVPVSPIINSSYGESLGRNAHTQLTQASIQPNFLGAVVKRIEATKPGVNPPLAQMGGEIGEDAAEKGGVIGRQLGFPDEIGGGGAAEGAVERGQLANLGRVHVGHDLSHAALGQLAQSGGGRRFRRRRGEAETHEMKLKWNASSESAS